MLRYGVYLVKMMWQVDHPEAYSHAQGKRAKYIRLNMVVHTLSIKRREFPCLGAVPREQQLRQSRLLHQRVGLFLAAACLSRTICFMNLVARRYKCWGRFRNW